MNQENRSFKFIKIIMQQVENNKHIKIVILAGICVAHM